LIVDDLVEIKFRVLRGRQLAVSSIDPTNLPSAYTATNDQLAVNQGGYQSPYWTQTEMKRTELPLEAIRRISDLALSIRLHATGPAYSLSEVLGTPYARVTSTADGVFNLQVVVSPTLLSTNQGAFCLLYSPAVNPLELGRSMTYLPEAGNAIRIRGRRWELLDPKRTEYWTDAVEVEILDFAVSSPGRARDDPHIVAREADHDDFLSHGCRAHKQFAGIVGAALDSVDSCVSRNVVDTDCLGRRLHVTDNDTWKHLAILLEKTTDRSTAATRRTICAYAELEVERWFLNSCELHSLRRTLENTRAAKCLTDASPSVEPPSPPLSR
jgi:hypothetical protein